MGHEPKQLFHVFVGITTMYVNLCFNFLPYKLLVILCIDLYAWILYGFFTVIWPKRHSTTISFQFNLISAVSAPFLFPYDDDSTSMDSGFPSITEKSWIWWNQPEHIISTILFDEGIHHSLQPCIICRFVLFIKIVVSHFYINSLKMVIWGLFHNSLL